MAIDSSLEFIHKGDTLIYTAEQVSRRVTRIEYAYLPPRDSDVIRREYLSLSLEAVAGGPGSQQAMEDIRNRSMTAETLWEDIKDFYAEMSSRNLFNAQLRDYTAAVARLEQYRVVEGQEEITEERPTGELDENGDPIMETVVIQEAIPPEPAEIEVPVYDPETGEQIGTEMVPNPVVVQDEQERAAAQATIDSTPQEVVDWYNEHNQQPEPA